MSSLTSQLIVSLLDKVSAPARGVARAVEQMRGRIDQNNAKLDAMRGRMAEATAVAYALSQAVSAPIRSAIAFESAMADVAKVTDFSAQGLSAYGKDLRRVATSEIPMAVTELAALSAEAAAAGVAQEDLLDFTRMTAKAALAWGVTGAQAGEDLAKIQSSMNLTIDQTARYADAINYMSDKMASNAPQLVDFSRRVAVQGEFFGFTKEQTLAFGSAMVAAGAEVDVAATSFKNMGRALTRGSSATKSQMAAFKVLGLNSTKVAKAMQKDAVGTTLKVIEKLGQIPEHMQAAVMSDLFGQEAAALTPLLSNVDLLRQALGYVGDETRYAGSVSAEFTKRSQTTEFAVQRFKNQLNDLGLTIGSILLPALNRIMDVLGPIVMRLAEFADAHPALTQAIIATTTALVALRIASIAAQFSFLWLKGGILTAAVTSLGSLSAAAGTVGTAFASMRTAMTGGTARKAAVEAAAGARAMADQSRAAYASAVSMQALARQGQVAGVSLQSANAAVRTAGREAAAAQVALASANAQLAATGPAARLAAAGMAVVRGALTALKVALIATGVGAAVVAIGAAGAFIYNNWSGIKEMFAGIGEGIMQAFPQLTPVFDAVSNAVGTLFGWFSKLTEPVDATSAQWRSFGVSIGQTIGEVIAKVAALPGAVAAYVAEMITSLSTLPAKISSFVGEMVAGLDQIPARLSGLAGQMIEAGKQLMQSLWTGMREVMGQIVSYIEERLKSAFDSAAAAARNLASKLTFGLVGGASAPPPVPGRAAGGAILGGRTYLVGEEGPELITPRSNGYVHTADETADMLSPSGVSAQPRGSAHQGTAPSMAGNPRSVAPSMPVHIEIQMVNHGVNDPETLSNQVIGIIERRLRDTMAGLQADMSYRVA
jgi:TP901 family phage tail tape measure protein